MKPLPESRNYSLQSVNPLFAKDVSFFSSSGIHVEPFLQDYFNLTEEQLIEAKETAELFSKSAEFKELLTEYLSKTELSEPNHYEPFVKLGNCVLTNVMANGDGKYRVELVNTNYRPIHGGPGKRRPDVILAPENAYFPPPKSKPIRSRTATNDVLMRHTNDVGASKATNPKSNTNTLAHPIPPNINWYNVLLPCEFKNTPEKTKKNADRQESKPEENESEPPQKRARGNNPPFSAVPDDGSRACTTSKERSKARATTVAGAQVAAAQTAPNEDLSFWSSLPESADLHIGERDPEVQLAGYCASMLSVRGDRAFAPGIIIDQRTIRIRYYSFKGIIMSDAIDIADFPATFVLIWSLFSRATLEQYGYNAKTGFLNPFVPDDMTTLRCGIDINPITSAGNGRTQQPDFSQGIRLSSVIFTQYGVVGRSTMVCELEGLAQEYPIDLVAKFSWQTKSRMHEEDVIIAAREVDPIHTPEIYASGVASDDTPFNRLFEHCGKKSHFNEEQELRLLIIRKYEPISKLKGEVFKDVLVQLMTCKFRSSASALTNGFQYSG